VIVRIFSEGQYRLPDGEHRHLHDLDRACVTALEAGDEAAFHSAFSELLELVRREGERISDDELLPSDLMLPPADISLEEAREEFTGEGLIPD
jgi:hypothetical protein